MALNAFEEVRLDPAIEFGPIGGPQFFTAITVTQGGYEQRVQQWEAARASYRSSHALQSQTEFDELLEFFYAMRGQLTGFRFRDWLDYASDMPGIIANGIRPDKDTIQLPASGVLTAQSLGSGDGGTVAFQITKTYPNPGTGDDYIRSIRKIVSDGTPGPADADVVAYVYLAGAVQTEGAGNDYTIDSTTGIITFTSPPGNGVAITADYLFDVPVRFASDLFEGSKFAFNIDNWDGIELVELRI